MRLSAKKLHRVCCTGWQTSSVIPTAMLSENYLVFGKREIPVSQKDRVMLCLQLQLPHYLDESCSSASSVNAAWLLLRPSLL